MSTVELLWEDSWVTHNRHVHCRAVVIRQLGHTTDMLTVELL